MLKFLNTKINCVHQLWHILSHYFFKYFFCFNSDISIRIGKLTVISSCLFFISIFLSILPLLTYWSFYTLLFLFYAISKLLLSHSTEYFIWVIVLLKSRISYFYLRYIYLYTALVESHSVLNYCLNHCFNSNIYFFTENLFYSLLLYFSLNLQIWILFKYLFKFLFPESNLETLSFHWLFFSAYESYIPITSHISYFLVENWTFWII